MTNTCSSYMCSGRVVGVTMTATTDAHDPGPSIDVVAQLAAIDAALGSVTPDLVPECVAGHQVAAVVRLLGRIERRAAGARLVLSKAAADGGAWKARGFRSPEEWLAREAGTTTGEARSTLKASDQLAALPAAREAAVSGDVSAEATKAVAEGATADPSVESDLVAKARTGDLADVRDKARQARTRADERDGKARTRMFGRRSLRAWVELDGEGHGHWNVPPEFQARFLAALEPYRAEAFRLAREAGHRERPEALMADALDMLSRDVLADLGLDDPTATEPPFPNPRPPRPRTSGRTPAMPTGRRRVGRPPGPSRAATGGHPTRSSCTSTSTPSCAATPSTARPVRSPVSAPCRSPSPGPWPTTRCCGSCSPATPTTSPSSPATAATFPPPSEPPSKPAIENASSPAATLATTSKSTTSTPSAKTGPPSSPTSPASAATTTPSRPTAAGSSPAVLAAGPSSPPDPRLAASPSNSIAAAAGRIAPDASSARQRAELNRSGRPR